MKQVFIVSVLLFLSVTVLTAADTKTGVLLDVMCGEMSAGNAEKVGEHKVACALMPNCQASGFGIVVGSEFLELDETGNEKALQILKNTKQKNSLKVEVSGDFSEGQVKVSSIQEVE